MKVSHKYDDGYVSVEGYWNKTQVNLYLILALPPTGCVLVSPHYKNKCAAQGICEFPVELKIYNSLLKHTKQGPL